MSMGDFLCLRAPNHSKVMPSEVEQTIETKTQRQEEAEEWDSLPLYSITDWSRSSALSQINGFSWGQPGCKLPGCVVQL